MTEPSMFSVQHEKITLWTRGCFVVFIISSLLLAGFVCGLYRASTQPVLRTESELINPNTAPVGSLVRLPGIGKARALDIIHFRQVNNNLNPAFKTAQDMEQIKGIGPKTAQKLKPYLTFETQVETK